MSEIQAVNTTYEPFSKEPEYIEANQQFVAAQDLGEVNRFLDLACGTGLISGMLLAANPTAHLNAIDYDPVQIDLAQQHLRSLGHPTRRGLDLTDDVVDGKAVVTQGVCSADDLPFGAEVFDCVTMCNAIHILPDKRKLLAGIHRVLRPAGIFGFNSSFYAGTYAEGTENHFFIWLGEANRYIQQLNKQREADGAEKIQRVRGGATHGAFQNKWFTEVEWVELLAEAGFDVHYRNTRVVMLDERCLKAVAAYGGLVEVLLSGYPVQIASEALQATVKRSLEMTGVPALGRNYLEIWARKR